MYHLCTFKKHAKPNKSICRKQNKTTFMKLLKIWVIQILAVYVLLVTRQKTVKWQEIYLDFSSVSW